MGQYKSRDAWDPTMMTGDGAKKQEGPNPAAELERDDYELGNLPVSDGRPPAPRPPGAPRLPWVLFALALVGAGAFAALAYWPLLRSSKESSAELAAVRDENAKLAATVD